MYYERQRGGLCRKHALNGYFGETKISTSEFNNFCVRYDRYMRERYHTKVPCKNFDVVPSNRMTIISFILKLYNINTILIPINDSEVIGKRRIKRREKIFDINKTKMVHGMTFFLKKRGYSSLEKAIGDGNSIFVFNKGHIWCMKKKDNVWYKIDSLSGVRKMNLSSVQNKKGLGFIIPRSHKMMEDDLLFNIVSLRKSLTNINHDDPRSMTAYLRDIYDKGLLLDSLEVLLGTTVEILEYIEDNSLAKRIVKDYSKFIKEYSFMFEKRDTSFRPIEQYIPNIIKGILLLENKIFP
jgi:hypothetical protein